MGLADRISRRFNLSVFRLVECDYGLDGQTLWLVLYGHIMGA